MLKKNWTKAIAVVTLCLMLFIWWKYEGIVLNAAYHLTNSKRKITESRQVVSPDGKATSKCQELLNPTQMQDEKHVIFWNVPCSDNTVAIEYVQEHYEKFDSSTGRFVLNSTWCGSCRFETSHDNYETSDAILFHSTGSHISKWPTKRTEKQIYAWWSTEHTSPNSGLLRENFYNVVMSYRRDEGVYVPYSTLPWTIKMLKEKNTHSDPMKKYAFLKQEYLGNDLPTDWEPESVPHLGHATRHKSYVGRNKENEKLIRKKYKFSVWIVSNCHDKQMPRKVLVESLMRAGLPLIQFGGCSQPLPVPSRWDPAFFEFVSRFKFYLAFENTIHCKDYMTEKLWNNALYSGAVPVIFGVTLEDARAALPVKSFVHAEQFASSQELVDFLKYLDKNASAYEEYLTWRTWTEYLNPSSNYLRWEIPDHDTLAKEYLCRPPTGLCGLCRLLHEKEKDRTFPVIQSSKHEWVGKENPDCLKRYSEANKIAIVKALTEH